MGCTTIGMGPTTRPVQINTKTMSTRAIIYPENANEASNLRNTAIQEHLRGSSKISGEGKLRTPTAQDAGTNTVHYTTGRPLSNFALRS